MELVGEENFGYHHAAGIIPVTVPEGAFVVSSIRNPCDQVLSEWQYQCERRYVSEVMGQDDVAAHILLGDRLDAQSCPTFQPGTTSDTLWSAVTIEPNYEGFWRSSARGTLRT